MRSAGAATGTDVILAHRMTAGETAPAETMYRGHCRRPSPGIRHEVSGRSRGDRCAEWTPRGIVERVQPRVRLRSDVKLSNEHLEVIIDVDHGAEITSVAKPDGPNALAWHDWATPIPAERSASYGNSQLDWLSRYRGGWQELFPNSGAASEHANVPVAFHGEASLSRWETLDASDTTCTLRVATRLPLVIERRMLLAADRSALMLEEAVENQVGVEVPFLWGHHPVFPAVHGARIDLPNAMVRPESNDRAGLAMDATRWPTASTTAGDARDLSEIPSDVMQRLLYVDEMEAAWAALRQPAGGQSVAMAWDAATFPVLWLWLLNGTDEFPWYGRACMLGVEPQTAWPYDGLAAAVKRGRAHRLAPRERRSTWLTLVLIDEASAEVSAVHRDGTVERSHS